MKCMRDLGIDRRSVSTLTENQLVIQCFNIVKRKLLSKLETGQPQITSDVQPTTKAEMSFHLNVNLNTHEMKCHPSITQVSC